LRGEVLSSTVETSSNVGATPSLQIRSNGGLCGSEIVERQGQAILASASRQGWSVFVGVI
jgi:hypothetical protein